MAPTEIRFSSRRRDSAYANQRFDSLPLPICFAKWRRGWDGSYGDPLLIPRAGFGVCEPSGFDSLPLLICFAKWRRGWDGSYGDPLLIPQAGFGVCEPSGFDSLPLLICFAKWRRGWDSNPR
jgi:hypothetical protein